MTSMSAFEEYFGDLDLAQIVNTHVFSVAKTKCCKRAFYTFVVKKVFHISDSVRIWNNLKLHFSLKDFN